MNYRNLIQVSVLIIITGAGCSSTKTHQWKAEHITTISGFNVPECTLYFPTDRVIFISNLDSTPEEYWSDDGKGHISALTADDLILTPRWLESKPESPLHSPRGMCLLGDYLYFADNKRLMRSSLSGGDAEIVATGFQKANDLATDGESIWLSDTVGKIYCISVNGSKREIPAPPGINGLTFDGDNMFGVSWDMHEIYELDPSGKVAPIPFNLSDHFMNLDSVEVLHDGTFVISDFTGNKLYTIGSDRTTVRVLLDIPTPADIGLNREDSILYIPQFMKDRKSVV